MRFTWQHVLILCLFHCVFGRILELGFLVYLYVYFLYLHQFPAYRVGGKILNLFFWMLPASSQNRYCHLLFCSIRSRFQTMTRLELVPIGEIETSEMAGASQVCLRLILLFFQNYLN